MKKIFMIHATNPEGRHMTIGPIEDASQAAQAHATARRNMPDSTVILTWDTFNDDGSPAELRDEHGLTRVHPL